MRRQRAEKKVADVFLQELWGKEKMLKQNILWPWVSVHWGERVETFEGADRVAYDVYHHTERPDRSG